MQALLSQLNALVTNACQGTMLHYSFLGIHLFLLGTISISIALLISRKIVGLMGKPSSSIQLGEFPMAV
jgi:hypothetical protein